MTSPMVKKVLELGEPVGDYRHFNPQWFITNAIREWAESDVFFRGADLSFAQRLNEFRLAEEVELVLFKKPGIDCFFGYPEARTPIMNQLGLSVMGAYRAEMTASIMYFLAVEGYEFIGYFKANQLIDYSQTQDGSPITKAIAIHKSHEGKVVRRRDHIGFKMTRGFGDDIMMLVPRDCLVPPERK